MRLGILGLLWCLGLATLAAQDFPHSVFQVNLGDPKKSVLDGLAAQGFPVTSVAPETTESTTKLNGYRVGVRLTFAGTDDASVLAAVSVRKVGWGDRLEYFEATLMKLQEKYGLPVQTTVGVNQTFTWTLPTGNRVELVEDTGTAEATLFYKSPAYDQWLQGQQKPVPPSPAPLPANPF